MRKLLFMGFAVCALAVASFAQNANYSGTWKLDLEKSTFSGPARIESMTLTVAQTDKDIKVETATKRAAPPADAPAGGPPGGGAGRGGRGGFGGDGNVTYALDGKETKVEIDSPMGKVPVTYKGSAESDGSIKLSTSRTFNGPQGEITTTTKETWRLSADGKTLTVDRENTSPRGAQTSKLVFIKG